MSIANWWARLTDAECVECGEPLSAFARSCPECGAPNKARVGAVAVVAALSVLAVAIAVTAVVILRWQRLPVSATSPPPPPAAGTQEPTAAAPGDFGWLTSAMQECDAQAEKEPATLHFLIIPLAAAQKNEEDWRSKSLNQIGNAILLSSDTALDGLKSQALRLAEQDYVFSVRDQAAAVYSWKRSTGVAKFSIANADAIDAFHIRFQTGERSGENEWGNAFVRKKGNCYWVNAIIAN